MRDLLVILSLALLAWAAVIGALRLLGGLL